MFHITDTLYHSCRKILDKYLGKESYGQHALPSTQLDLIAKALSVELLPMIITELHRALTDLGKLYSTPQIIKLEKEDG